MAYRQRDMPSARADGFREMTVARSDKEPSFVKVIGSLS